MNAGNVLRETSRRLPDKKAVIFGNRFFTFRDLNHGADCVARFLVKRGVGKGDRVGIIFPNIPEFVPVYFGILRLGAIAVPLDVRFKGEELSSILTDAEVNAVFIVGQKFGEVQPALEEVQTLHTVVCAGGEPSGGEALEAILRDKTAMPPEEPQIDEDDEALYLYTSGTTGKPKGVVLTFRNLDFFPLTMNKMVSAGEKDVVGFILPVSHISGPVVSNLIALNGSTMAMFEHLRPDKILEAVGQHEVTYFFGVPPIFQSLLRVPHRDRYQLRSLAYVSMMGTHIPYQLLREFREAFPSVKAIQGYGLTETSPFISLLPLAYADLKMGSVGLPAPEIEIRMTDEEGKEVPRGEVGEIVVRGPMVMKEYHKNPEATAEMIKQGWLHTGDLGKLDEEGFLYHLGRKDDMIITGGLNVFPAEVESVLLKHPDILEAGAVGVPDQDRGQIIKAVVVLQPERTLDKKNVISFCQDHLANFKVPKLVEFRSDLPKTSTGKISRRDLL